MERNELQPIERLLVSGQAKPPASLRENLLSKVEVARSQTRDQRRLARAFGILILTILLAAGSLGYQNWRIHRLIMSCNDQVSDFYQRENNAERNLSNPKQAAQPRR